MSRSLLAFARLAAIVLVSDAMTAMLSVPVSANSFLPASDQAAQGADVLDRARQLATSGQRPQAVALLQDRLKASPDDVDARTLLGLVLSWDGKYVEARAELHKVLETSPGYDDAAAALANVELWDGHPDVALELATSVLARNTKHVGMLLTKARAERDLGRMREARDTISRVLEIEPDNAQGKALQSQFDVREQPWAVGYGIGGDWFSDHRPAWREQWVVLKRRSAFGSASFTISQADRFGLRDRQFELEAYPSLRPGRYMYVDAGASQSDSLYPRYRLGAQLYQSLPDGFEASVGFSRLGFGSGINILTGSISKYVGNWMLTGQMYLTPHLIGTNASYHVAMRRYFSDRNYLGIRYHYGAAKENIRTINDVLGVNDVRVLNANGMSGEAVWLLGSRVDLIVRGAYENQQRYQLSALAQYSASSTFNIHF